LKKRDLLVGEPAGLTAGDRNRPDGRTALKERYHSRASVAYSTCVGTLSFEHSRIGLDVGNIGRGASANDPSVRLIGEERPWKGRPHSSLGHCADTRHRGEHDLIVHNPRQQA
jgi:hypothetical protein